MCNLSAIVAFADGTSIRQDSFCKPAYICKRDGRGCGQGPRVLPVSRDLDLVALSKVLNIPIPVRFCWVFPLAEERRLHGSLIIQRALYQVCISAVQEAAPSLGLRTNSGQWLLLVTPRLAATCLCQPGCDEMYVFASMLASCVPELTSWQSHAFFHVGGWGLWCVCRYCWQQNHFHNLISCWYSLEKRSNFGVSGSYQGCFRIWI